MSPRTAAANSGRAAGLTAMRLGTWGCVLGWAARGASANEFLAWGGLLPPPMTFVPVASPPLGAAAPAPLGAQAPAPSAPAGGTAGATSACESGVMRGSFAISGMPPMWMAGENATSSGNEMRISHEAGVSVFSSCEKEWEPASITQFQLLGKTIRYTVDLREVACACNLAVYLISTPALDRYGRPHPGKDRDGQPPYYCDANKVGGQWCPEVDIMEANTHAFQSTLHKCDAPVKGHYKSCDRSGCPQNTRVEPELYGPGEGYKIDTRRPFVVETEFPAKDGILLGMRTILRQGAREAVLAHASCDPKYLRDLSAAMRDGMSLRITYWGDTAQTMAWMDDGVCGASNCSAETAGDARLRDFAVSPEHDLDFYRARGFRPLSEPPEMQWAPDLHAPWQCHNYASHQQETLWCAFAGIQGGYEFNYNAGNDSPCGGCWCCKRKAVRVPATAGYPAERGWMVSGRDDLLFGQLVPQKVIDDPSRFVQMDGHGVVEWRGAKRFVRLVIRGELPEADSDADFFEDEDSRLGRLGLVMKKFDGSLPRGALGDVALASVSPALFFFFGAVAVVVALGGLLRRRTTETRPSRTRTSPPGYESFQVFASEGAGAPAGDDAETGSSLRSWPSSPRRPGGGGSAAAGREDAAAEGLLAVGGASV